MWTRWNDIDRMFGAMDLLRSRMNRGYLDENRSPGYGLNWGMTEHALRANLYDAGDHLEIKAETPGLAREDLNIKIQGNYLEISGERKISVPEGYTPHRVETKAVSVTRSFTLPAEVNAEKAEAALKNGVLTLILPKAEAAKPKKIAIN